jgi:predicted Co/Zn/Cd cation transporter (cation efflux family)
LGLAIFTIAYNLVEGLVSVYFGITDESLTLFGFGADSFIEMISGAGIASMVLRIKKNELKDRNIFEKRALRVTGTAFYLLVAGLLITAGYNLFTGHKPETTIWGVVISLISIVVMLVLLFMKLHVGKNLDSQAIVADAHCTKICIYMSVVLLITSAIFELTGIGWIDIMGTLALAWFSFNEGRECFEKARTNSLCGCHSVESK